MTLSLDEHAVRDLNMRIAHYLRRSALRSRNHERIGSFVATFRDGDDNPYLNYAIPDDGLTPSPAEIGALVAAFEARKRTPRLEYVPAAAPGVEAALIDQGFKVQRRTPIMLCTADMVQGEAKASGFEVFLASAEADLTGAETAQAEAYDGPSRGPAGLRRTLAGGGLVAAARDTAGALIVGAALVAPAVDGISELAAVGVLAAFRRRGAAGALTVLLAREAFARGFALLWLTPEDSDTQRIYARAGFAVASEALHISR